VAKKEKETDIENTHLPCKTYVMVCSLIPNLKKLFVALQKFTKAK